LSSHSAPTTRFSVCFHSCSCNHRDIHSFPTRRSSDLLLDQHVTDKTKLLVLNTPSNPTGAIMSEEDARAVAQYCLDHNILVVAEDRKSTRLNSSHVSISYAVFCLKKKKKRYDFSSHE